MVIGMITNAINFEEPVFTDLNIFTNMVAEKSPVVIVSQIQMNSFDTV